MPKAMQAMAKDPDTNRRDAVEKLVTAAGGKLVAMYGTMVDGPGAMVIVDVDPGVGAAIAAVVASSDGVQNVKAQRLFSMDEVLAIRKKRVQLQASYSPPGDCETGREPQIQAERVLRARGRKLLIPAK